MVDPLNNISARQIALSGLRAQRIRMDVIANNIANAETTRTPQGGAFRRQLAIFRGHEIRPGASADKAGVAVRRIISDPSPLRQVYDPAHPDANPNGYVNYPNVQMAVEMANLVAAQRAYEANIAVMATSSRMNESALQMLQR
jgi:flagellar basal-body rod protein FlgC